MAGVAPAVDGGARRVHLLLPLHAFLWLWPGAAGGMCRAPGARTAAPGGRLHGGGAGRRRVVRAGMGGNPHSREGCQSALDLPALAPIECQIDDPPKPLDPGAVLPRALA